MCEIVAVQMIERAANRGFDAQRKKLHLIAVNNFFIVVINSGNDNIANTSIQARKQQSHRNILDDERRFPERKCDIVADDVSRSTEIFMLGN